MFLTYHTVPKTYLAVQDRELVSDPTNRSARNGQNTKSFNMVGLLTTARGWHGAFTPAHEVSQNRPKQSGLSIDITPQFEGKYAQPASRRPSPFLKYVRQEALDFTN